MSETFAGAAARLAGLAGGLLGWRPGEFWRSTPTELAAVLEAVAPAGPNEPVGTAELARLMEMFPDG